jgi:hypothetical protein
MGCSGLVRRSIRYAARAADNKASIRGIAVQPARNSVWQHMSLITDLQLGGIGLPQEVVDLAAGSAAKARKGELEMKSPGSVAHHNSKHQRGTEFFSKLFGDIQKAANSLSAEDSKPHPVLFVDMTSWGGDSVASC